MTSTPETAQPAPRLYYLDALRVLAIGMVFLFHAVHPFDMWYWHIKNVQQSLALTMVITVLAIWGMPFFFMIAGMGSWFALRRRTPRQYATERTKRLLVPFLFWTIFVFFLTQYFEWGNKLYRGETAVTFPGYLQIAFTWMSGLGFSPEWAGLGVHLWFLAFLWLFAILTLPLFLWLKRDKGRRMIDWLAKICRVRGGLLLFVLPPFIIRALLSPSFPAEHDWSDFFFQGAFFILGFLLFTHDDILKAVRRDGWLLGGIGLGAVLTILALFLLGQPVIEWGEWYGTPQFYVAWFLVVLIAVTWCLCVLSIGMRTMNVDKSWLRYAQEIALPFFILHQPVIIVIASFVVKWYAGIPFKMLAVVPGSFFVTWALCEFVVKRVGFLRFLFGMTSPRPGQRKEAPLAHAPVE